MPLPALWLKPWPHLKHAKHCVLLCPVLNRFGFSLSLYKKAKAWSVFRLIYFCHFPYDLGQVTPVASHREPVLSSINDGKIFSRFQITLKNGHPGQVIAMVAKCKPCRHHLYRFHLELVIERSVNNGSQMQDVRHHLHCFIWCWLLNSVSNGSQVQTMQAPSFLFDWHWLLNAGHLPPYH